MNTRIIIFILFFILFFVHAGHCSCFTFYFTEGYLALGQRGSGGLARGRRGCGPAKARPRGLLAQFWDLDEDGASSPVAGEATKRAHTSSPAASEITALAHHGVANARSANILVAVHNVSPNGSSIRRITSWQKGELLGRGSHGGVYEGLTNDGLFFAVKEVSLLDQERLSLLEREISLLSQFEHENIVRYLGTDKDDKNLYIFLEHMSKGSLAALYHKYNLRDSHVSAYTKQILTGLKYLHDQNVVHRDIKCANILVDVSGSVKLADFGLAKVIKRNDVNSSKGTPFWMAPEVVNPKNRDYGLPADIWSLGCTVLEMLTRQHPYPDLEPMQALFKIGRGEPPSVRSTLSRDAQSFILECLQENPDNRPSAAQLLDHLFVSRPPTSSPRFNNMWSYGFAGRSLFGSLL